jgi:hypothetical protein
MAKKAVFIIVLITMICADAQCADDHNIVRTKPLEDLILEVWLDRTNGLVSTSSPIGYGWFTETNTHMIVDIPKDEFLCSVQMFDTNGNAVRIREDYAKLGHRFFDLAYPSTEQRWNDVENVLRIRPAHGTQSAAPDSVFASQKSCEGRYLPSPESLFDVVKPGNYTVKLQFQAYERRYIGGEINMYKLERFAPVEFTVTKSR